MSNHIKPQANKISVVDVPMDSVHSNPDISAIEPDCQYINATRITEDIGQIIIEPNIAAKN